MNVQKILDQQPKKVLFWDDSQNQLVFKDEKVTVYPIEFTNSQGESCFSYLCIPNQGDRKFLPQKAKNFKGLVPKLHFKDLVNGITVTLEDGTQVTPEDVCDPPVPSQCFAFVFLPDSSFLEGFEQNLESSFLENFSASKIDSDIHKLVTIYHSVPKDVYLDKRYLQVMQSKFPS